MNQAGPKSSRREIERETRVSHIGSPSFMITGITMLTVRITVIK